MSGKDINRMIPFSPPDISELEIAEAAEALRSGWITTGPRTKRLDCLLYTSAFAALVEEATGTEIIFSDERLTTVFAERALLEADVSRKKRRKVIDKLAAVTILQGYLDSLK